MKHLQKFYKKGVTFLIIILIGFLSGALGSFVTLQLYQKQVSQATNNTTNTVTQTSYKNENATTQAVNKVKDAVVSVITYSSNRQNIHSCLCRKQSVAYSLVQAPVEYELFLHCTDPLE